MFAAFVLAVFAAAVLVFALAWQQPPPPRFRWSPDDHPGRCPHHDRSQP